MFVMALFPVVTGQNPYPAGALWYWCAGTTVLLIVILAPERLTRPLSERYARAVSGFPATAWPVMAGLLAFAVSVSVAVVVFHGAANTPDEIAQYWHARVLSAGMLSLPVDPNREFFALETIVDVGRWYSQFPIGGPASLVPGALIGVPWIVNPLLAGIATALLYVFARAVHGQDDARRSSLLFATLPMTVFMAGTWMNHVPTMLLGILALCCLAGWDAIDGVFRRRLFAAGIGLALGLMATIRPLDAVAVAVPIGLFQLFRLKDDRGRSADLAVQVVAGLVGVLPLLIANAFTTGGPFTFGYDVLWGGGHRVGFHTDPYGNRHTPGAAFGIVVGYIADLDLYLGAWPFPIMLALAAGIWFIRRSRWDALAAGLLVSQLVAYALYWGEGTFLGPRFLYTAVPAMALLLGRLPANVATAAGESAGRRAGRLLLFSVAAAWMIPGVAFNALGLSRQAANARENLRVGYADVVRRAGVHDAVVTLREPFTARIARRLWGVGSLRSDAAQLVSSRDACVLHDSLNAIERDGRRGAAAAAAIIVIPPFNGSSGRVPTTDPRALVAPSRMSESCRQELADDDRFGFTPFGPAIPLEPITADGRVDGDVVYVADLGSHNAAIAARFRDRRWYRLVLSRDGENRLTGRLIEY